MEICLIKNATQTVHRNWALTGSHYNGSKGHQIQLTGGRLKTNKRKYLFFNPLHYGNSLPQDVVGAKSLHSSKKLLDQIVQEKLTNYWAQQHHLCSRKSLSHRTLEVGESIPGKHCYMLACPSDLPDVSVLSHRQRQDTAPWGPLVWVRKLFLHVYMNWQPTCQIWPVKQISLARSPFPKEPRSSCSSATQISQLHLLIIGCKEVKQGYWELQPSPWPPAPMQRQLLGSPTVLWELLREAGSTTGRCSWQGQGSVYWVWEGRVTVAGSAWALSPMREGEVSCSWRGECTA